MSKYIAPHLRKSTPKPIVSQVKNVYAVVEAPKKVEITEEDKWLTKNLHLSKIHTQYNRSIVYDSMNKWLQRNVDMVDDLYDFITIQLKLDIDIKYFDKYMYQFSTGSDASFVDVSDGNGERESFYRLKQYIYHQGYEALYHQNALYGFLALPFGTNICKYSDTIEKETVFSDIESESDIAETDSYSTVED